MVVALGMDLAELPRIAAALERRGEAFLERVFTEHERTALGDDGPALVARAAARFAAKEAAFKALGTGWGQGVTWHDVEVRGGRGRPPEIVLSGRALERQHALGSSRALVTLTHTDTVAGATVVLV